MFGNVSATDDDLANTPNSEIVFSIVNGDPAGQFAIDATTGRLSSVGGALLGLDRETVSSYNLTVQATDKGTPRLSSTCLVTVTILDQNDNAPILEQSEYAFNVTEDSSQNTGLLFVLATDNDAGINAQVSYAIAGGNAGGFFSISETSGLVSLAKPLDRETTSSYPLVIIASDRGTPSLSSTPSILTITVLDANDNTPVFDQLVTSVTVSESAELSTSVALVGATDKDVGTNALLSFTISGDDGKFAIDSNGNITVIGVLDRESKSFYNLTVTGYN